MKKQRYKYENGMLTDTHTNQAFNPGPDFHLDEGIFGYEGIFYGSLSDDLGFAFLFVMSQIRKTLTDQKMRSYELSFCMRRTIRYFFFYHDDIKNYRAAENIFRAVDRVHINLKKLLESNKGLISYSCSLMRLSNRLTKADFELCRNLAQSRATRNRYLEAVGCLKEYLEIARTSCPENYAGGSSGPIRYGYNKYCTALKNREISGDKISYTKFYRIYDFYIHNVYRNRMPDYIKAQHLPETMTDPLTGDVSICGYPVPYEFGMPIKGKRVLDPIPK